MRTTNHGPQPRSGFPALAVATLLLAPWIASPALASDQAHGAGWGQFIWQVLNFGALVGLLVYMTREPIRNFFGERREKIVSEIDQASQLLKQAELRFSEWQRKLADLDARLEEIREDARARAQREREAILEDAHQAAERIRSEAAAAVEQELRRARRVLREEASDLAMEIAADLLRENVGAADRQRLLDEFIGRVEASGVGS